MKKASSLLLCFFLVLGTMIVPASAAGSTTTNATLWSAMSDGQLTSGVTLGTGTSVDTQWVPGTIQDEADWNGQYNMVQAELPAAISGKTINLSFDYYAEATHWGAPSFSVNVFHDTTSFVNSAASCYKGFFAYDEPGQNDHTAGEAYYNDTKTYFTYYGNENAYNVAPGADSGKARMAHTRWQHIDCIYDLVNQKVTYFVDGERLGTAKGPSVIAGLTFKKENYVNGKSVYYGKMRLNNIKITEVNAGGLSWTLTANADNLVLNFSEPMTALNKEMISITDMEDHTVKNPVSVEKITPYQWKANVEALKQNAEYKINVAALTGGFSGTAQEETLYIYTGSEGSFGVKNVRYNEKISNIATVLHSTFADDFSSYSGKYHPGENTTNDNDYADNSSGAWSRYGHTKSTSWWGQGTYVEAEGKQLAIDNYSNSNPVSIGAVRNIGSNVKDKIFEVSFDAAYYNLDPHGASCFNVLADEVSVLSIDRNGVYLDDWQANGGKIKIAENTFQKGNYGKDLVKISLSFDFTSGKIKAQYGEKSFCVPIKNELRENGFSTLKFVIHLVEGINNNDSANGTHRGNAALVDNYQEKIFNVSFDGTFNKGLELSNAIAVNSSSIDVTFTDAVKEETISGITITDGGGNVVAYSPELSADKKTVSLGVRLKQNTDYTLIIPNTVQSIGGVNNAREYSYSFGTNSAIKFYNANGNELAEADLQNAPYVKYAISSPAPTASAGECIVISAVYKKANNSLKETTVLTKIPYRAGDIITCDDEITLAEDEYAKIFFWDFVNFMKPVFDKCYTIGK